MISMKRLPILVLLILMLLLAGCTRNAEEFSSRHKGLKEITKSHSMHAVNVSIYPENPTVKTLITLTTDRSFIEGSQIHLYINDIMEKTARGLN